MSGGWPCLPGTRKPFGLSVPSRVGRLIAGAQRCQHCITQFLPHGLHCPVSAQDVGEEMVRSMVRTARWVREHLSPGVKVGVLGRRWYGSGVLHS